MPSNRSLFGAVLCVSLVAAGLAASSAFAVEFHSEGPHTILRSEDVSEPVLVFKAGTVSCSHVTGSGTGSSSTSTTQTFTPSYTGCKAFGFVNTTIDTNGCSYRYDSNAKNVDVLCGASPITITAFNCWVTIGSQENIGAVTHTNVGSGSSRHIHRHVHKWGTTYTQHSKSFPGCTNGTFTDGTETITETIRDSDTLGNQTGTWVA